MSSETFNTSSEHIAIEVPRATQAQIHRIRFNTLRIDPEKCVFVGVSEKKEDECPICQEEYVDEDLLVKELGCGHTFCSECFLKAAANNLSCPMCRRPIEQVTVPTTIRNHPEPVRNPSTRSVSRWCREMISRHRLDGINLWEERDATLDPRGIYRRLTSLETVIALDLHKISDFLATLRVDCSRAIEVIAACSNIVSQLEALDKRDLDQGIADLRRHYIDVLLDLEGFANRLYHSLLLPGEIRTLAEDMCNMIWFRLRGALDIYSSDRTTG